MTHPSDRRLGQPRPRPRPTSLDLILQARALRYQWFAAAPARLSARLAGLGSGLVARARPGRMPRPERLRFSRMVHQRGQAAIGMPRRSM
jgi:hypothetical protein